MMDFTRESIAFGFIFVGFITTARGVIYSAGRRYQLTEELERRHG